MPASMYPEQWSMWLLIMSTSPSHAWDAPTADGYCAACQHAMWNWILQISAPSASPLTHAEAPDAEEYDYTQPHRCTAHGLLHLLVRHLPVLRRRLSHLQCTCEWQDVGHAWWVRVHRCLRRPQLLMQHRTSWSELSTYSVRDELQDAGMQD